MFDTKKFSELVTETQGNRSLNEYARNCGVSSAYISKLKNMATKTAPSPVIIRKLASKSESFSSSLPDSVTYISMMKAAGHITSEMNNDDYNNLDTGEEEAYALNNNFIEIPIIENINSLNPIIDKKNNKRSRIEYPDNLPNGDLFYFETKEDSMAPLIPVGSLVLIKQIEGVEDGEIAAVTMTVDNKLVLRRVKKQGNIIMLIPENTEFEPIVVTKDNPITILGKAVRVTVDL